MVDSSHTNELNTPMCANTLCLTARGTFNSSVVSTHRRNHEATPNPSGRPINGVKGNTHTLPDDKYVSPSNAIKRITL